MWNCTGGGQPVSLANIRESVGPMSESSLLAIFTESDEDDSGDLDMDELAEAIRRAGLTKAQVRTVQKLVYPKTHSMRVVAENAMDATSRLSLNPVSSHAVPDFVNVQAIYARVLNLVWLLRVYSLGVPVFTRKAFTGTREFTFTDNLQVISK